MTPPCRATDPPTPPKRGLGELIRRRPSIPVAAVALAVHLLFLAAAPAEMLRNESADYLHFYRPVAERILDGQGPVDPGGTLAVRYPPGFPLLIAGAVGISRLLPGSEETWLRAQGALWVTASAALVAVLARLLTGQATVALLAGLLWAVYPPFLWLSKQPNSELPFLVLMLGGVALVAWAVRGRREKGASSSALVTLAALAGGLALGLATLVRPIALLLSPALAGAVGVWALRHQGLRHLRLRRGALLAAALVAGQALMVLPWILFVYLEVGHWMPVSSAGRLAILDGLTLGAQDDEASPPLSPEVLELTHTVEANRRQIRGPASAAAFLARYAAEKPGAVVELLAIKAARAWYGTESVRHEGVLLLVQLPLLALAALGLWRLGRQDLFAAALILAAVLCFWAMTVLALSILRYMVPAMALLMVPIAGVLVDAAPRLTRPRT